MPDMTHPKGMTAEDREAAQRIWHMCDDGPYCELPNWLIQSFARHRLSSTAALEAEIASLKQRLESAEAELSELKSRMWRELSLHGRITETVLQEQEKQNG